ncbi:MAG: hypothetical protein NEA02_12895, partial [Thermoanaerobaculia bacterium]|nr:hypothetical protein [Thermoanaerobaculia bacterium]
MTGASRLVSVSSAGPGKTGNGIADSPVISSDGRWVAYASSATDAVSGVSDTNQATDVFLFDRTSGGVVLVSHSASFPWRSASGFSSYPSVSGDGRWVAFSSLATDLLAGQSGSPTIWNVYLWDRSTGLITLASHAAGSGTTPGNANSGNPLISRDGTTIVFSSQAPNLAPAAGPSQQIYAFDRASGVNRLVSHATGLPGIGGNGWSMAPDVSADGRFVSFETTATNIVPGQTGSGALSNVFIWDGSSGTNLLASHAAGSPVSAAGGSSHGASVSADGLYVAYSSDALDLVPGFVNGNASSPDVYLFDRVANLNALVSRRLGTTATGGNGDSSASAISSDGSRIVFSSLANDLISGLFDLNADSDVFVFDRLSGTTTLASHLPSSPLSPANGSSGGGLLSGDGAFVVYQTLSTDL